MFRKNLLYFVATITLLFSAASCNNGASNNAGAGNVAANETTAQVGEQPITSPTATPVAFKPEVDPAKSAKYTNEAKFLAGMKVDGGPLASSEKSQSWQAHAAFFNNTWARLEKQQLSNLRKWASKELKPVNSSAEVVFYPFSGPDFLYGYSFFPKQKTYIMVGLEPVGSLPNLAKASTVQINRDLQGIQQSLRALLQWSFFRTNDMSVDLSQKGVLPILFVFLARTNNKITDVQYIGLKKDSTIQTMEKGNKGKLLPGIKINFVPPGESEPRSLYYFSADLSNSGLKKTPEFNKFIENSGEFITYIKSASYLMHYDSFSNIRKLILSKSSDVLQDDSGIPVKYFDRSKWNLKFYGSYTQPIALFQEEYQPNLKSIYQNKSSVKPLTFGIGYRYRVNDSNLMLATGK